MRRSLARSEAARKLRWSNFGFDGHEKRPIHLRHPPRYAHGKEMLCFPRLRGKLPEGLKGAFSSALESKVL